MWLLGVLQLVLLRHRQLRKVPFEGFFEEATVDTLLPLHLRKERIYDLEFLVAQLFYAFCVKHQFSGGKQLVSQRPDILALSGAHDLS